jgi:hypothetical protein
MTTKTQVQNATDTLTRARAAANNDIKGFSLRAATLEAMSLLPLAGLPQADIIATGDWTDYLKETLVPQELNSTWGNLDPDVDVNAQMRRVLMEVVQVAGWATKTKAFRTPDGKQSRNAHITQVGEVWINEKAIPGDMRPDEPSPVAKASFAQCLKYAKAQFKKPGSAGRTDTKIIQAVLNIVNEDGDVEMNMLSADAIALIPALEGWLDEMTTQIATAREEAGMSEQPIADAV